MKNYQIVAVVAIICCVGNVFGYQIGAPPSQCVDMTPAVPPTGRHGTGQTTSSSPYIITTNASTGYTPGQTYSVTISKRNAVDTNFKGFLCQIRQVGQTTALGTFSVRDASKSKTITCTSSKGAVTHTNNAPVENQIFDWTAPFVPLGVNTTVQAVCTVVQQLLTLWIQLKSEPFQELALPAGEVRTNPPTTEPPSVPSIPFDFSGCGSQTLCYRDPTDCAGPGDCKYALIVQYDDSTERLTFHLASNAGGFAAVGFSTDTSMGMDDVIGCQGDPNNNNLAYGKDCWNPNGRNPNQYDADQTSIVSEVGAFVDGAVVCRIVRVLTPADTTQDYDLSQPYRLLFARGSGRGGSTEGLAKHSVAPGISDKAVNITVPQVIGVEGKPLIKAHGILMTFAWIGAAPTGIFLARYFKVVWPNGNWFHGHRAHMITALVLTIIGIIIIFVEAEEWVYNSSNEGSHNAHPIIGFIVAVGATIQPIMAAFRPHPGTPKRPIFYWAHYLVGMVTLSLGIDAVILGLIFARDKHLTGLSNVASNVLYAWIGLQLSVWIAMEVIAYKYRKGHCAGTCSTDKSGGIEMKSHKDSDDPNSAPDKQPSEDAHIRKSLLVIFVILNVGMSLIIAIYIGIADV